MADVPKVGDVVLCFWSDEEAAFAALIVGEGVYETEDSNYPYFDVKRANGHILMISPGDVRRLSDVK